MSLEVGLKKIRLILLEDYLVLLLGLGDPRFKWMFSELDLLRELYRFIGDWEYKLFTARWCEHFLCIESFSLDFRYVHLFQFFDVRDQDVSFPACNAYPRKILDKIFGPNWCSRDRSFTEIRWLFYHRSKQSDLIFKWYTEPPFIRWLPIRQEILNVS